MAANVVERPQAAVLASDQEGRTISDIEDGAVAGMAQLGRMGGKKPTPAPDPFELEPVDRRGRGGGPGQGITGRLAGQEIVDRDGAHVPALKFRRAPVTT